MILPNHPPIFMLYSVKIKKFGIKDVFRINGSV